LARTGGKRELQNVENPLRSIDGRGFKSSFERRALDLSRAAKEEQRQEK
jgi:hypothetical protein